jgi:hypothetical protein
METIREWFERWQAEFAWQMDGVCWNGPGVDEGWFVPGPAFDPQRAAAVCVRCPIKQRCGEYADEHPGLDGIWGGKVQGRPVLKIMHRIDTSEAIPSPAAPKRGTS